MIRVALLLALVAIPAVTQAESWSIAASDVRDVRAADGTAYRIILRRPSGEPPAGGWPSLWLLDACAWRIGCSFARFLPFHIRPELIASKWHPSSELVA